MVAGPNEYRFMLLLANSTLDKRPISCFELRRLAHLLLVLIDNLLEVVFQDFDAPLELVRPGGRPSRRRDEVRPQHLGGGAADAAARMKSDYAAGTRDSHADVLEHGGEFTPEAEAMIQVNNWWKQ